MSVLVFDTETTGLPKIKFINKDTLHLWPHIVQFSYIIFNYETNTIEKIKDCIIKIPDSIIIPEESIKFHGITNKIMNEKGVNIENIFEEFFNDFMKVDHIVGHNISFDINMVKVELNRILINNSKNIRKSKRIQNYLNILNETNMIYCTMQESINLCAIEVTNKLGQTYNKFPKLIELYDKLFNIRPNNLHNSLNDVIVCLRCFMKLKYNVDIVDQNQEIKNLIINYL